jgi:hypothetical protein
MNKSESDAESYIWYAAYGSNLLKERFMCYLKGGFRADYGIYDPLAIGIESPYCEACFFESIPVNILLMFVSNNMNDEITFSNSAE